MWNVRPWSLQTIREITVIRRFQGICTKNLEKLSVFYKVNHGFKRLLIVTVGHLYLWENINQFP